MQHLRLLLVAATTLALTFLKDVGVTALTVDEEGCVLPTFDIVGRELQREVSRLATEGGSPATVLQEIFLNCASVGTVKDQFRELTYTLLFATEGSATDLVALMDMRCSGNQWIVVDGFFPGEGIQSNDTLTACGRCSKPAAMGEVGNCLRK